MNNTNYKDIFLKIEKSFKAYANLTDLQFKNTFDHFINLRFIQRPDEDYYEILKMIPFYSGFRAVTVENKKAVINKHFPDFGTISAYDDSKISEILIDPEMIKSEAKISATVHNARKFKEIIEVHKTFQKYLESFNPEDSFENLMLLKEELQYKFKYLGAITVYHFLTDIGLNVLKPDRVLTRIFKRLGLIEDENQFLKTVIHGRKFASATGMNIRYIDIVFVKYGQQGISEELKIKGGICLEHNPKCQLCGVTDYCTHYKKMYVLPA